MHYLVKLEAGNLDGAKWELHDQPLIIGRSKRAQINIADEQVSSMHCVVIPAADGFGIVDLNSADGTWVNGRKVYQSPLALNARIRVGNTTFVLRKKKEMGLNTAIREVEKEHEESGKGYSTMFRELVKKMK